MRTQRTLTKAQRTLAVLALAMALGAARSESAPVVIATYPNVSGQTLTVEDLGSIAYTTSRIASCSAGVLYTTRTDGTLWVNLTDGEGTWAQVAAGAPGTRIACDRNHLYALDSGGSLWHALTKSNGQLTVSNGEVWTADGYGVPPGTTEIGSGLGNIYALDHDPAGSTLWSSALPDGLNNDHYQGQPGSWIWHAGNLGIRNVAGAGTLALITPPPYVSSRPENRVYGSNPDGSLYFNDKMLNGINGWSGMPNAGLNNFAITVDAPNVLYGLRSTGGFGLGKKLYRYTFTEAACTDGLDNDANGMRDGEDPACRSLLAAGWCATHTGTYCMDRIPGSGYSRSLVTCSGGGATLTAGVCVKAAVSGADYLKPLSQVYNPEPPNSGHYCNVVAPDGTWAFDWTGSTPCDTLLAQKPDAKIVRAGIYSTVGTNSIQIKCTDGGVVGEAAGTSALASANSSVGHTNNRCVVTVSPKELRVFGAPFPTATWASPDEPGARGYSTGHMFDHGPACQPNDPLCPCGPNQIHCWFDRSQFGTGPGLSTDFDNRGLNSGGGQNSYDYGMAEGTPMLAMGWGRVIDLGSRDRDISGMALDGSTPYQGEVFVQYDIGADPVYRESFVAYYAHLRRRSVVDGETVAPLQVIGYSGTSGASGGPHLHFGLVRVTNTNATTGTTPAQLAYGYQLDFDPNPNHNWGAEPTSLTGMVDPYGWRAPAGIDPYGHYWSRAKTPGNSTVLGLGAWGPSVWRTDQVPPYPQN